MDYLHYFVDNSSVEQQIKGGMYSDKSMGWTNLSSIAGRKKFLFFKSPRPALTIAHPPLILEGSSAGGKVAEAWY
jgi:hypothetical protein